MLVVCYFFRCLDILFGYDGLDNLTNSFFLDCHNFPLVASGVAVVLDVLEVLIGVDMRSDDIFMKIRHLRPLISFAVVKA